MNIIKRIDQYNENYVHFCESIKNNIMNNGNFIRILYSTHMFTINGIYLFISLNDVMIEKYYNKYKCSFNISAHVELLESLSFLEASLLKKANLKNKMPQFKIHEQFKNGNIKIFSETQPKQNTNTFLLKISGIWETDTHYGVTYKFSKINDC